MAVFHKTTRSKKTCWISGLYIAQDNPSAADHLLDVIEEKGRLLAKNPKLGQARPDITEDFRYLPVGRYLMLYREIQDGIELVRVIHGMRSMGDL